jgi:uncharacterized protein YjhX (UPF0386 family)
MDKRLFQLGLFMILGTLTILGQKRDTTFFADNRIRSIEMDQQGIKVLTVFNSLDGDNLLGKGDFIYSYFDSTMNMSRVVDIKAGRISREFWTSNNDTIYNTADFDKKFNKQITAFINYIYNNQSYSKEALEKRIEGNVKISFIVDKNGEITRIKPLTNVGSGLEDVSIQLISKYKKWGIITIDKVPVSCYFRFPISYRLQ